jgi:poly-gamma-glutamate synthesis protein (capsule biosynthesis protein)
MSFKFKPVHAMSLMLIIGAVAAAPSLIANTDTSDEEEKILPDNIPSNTIEFTFTAFGDSGWAETHTSRPSYQGGFKAAFRRFDPKKTILGDINYINWETSIGTHCEQFWSKSTPSTYAFLTHPKELADTIQLGFNVVGLANNHSFDCLRSQEGNGPMQSYNFVKSIRKDNPNIALSGVFAQRNQEPVELNIKTEKGLIPITFASAYVGGSQIHCANMLCLNNLGSTREAFTNTNRLRIVALHSWNKATHNQLKATLKSMIRENLVDIAIGSGPHVEEKIEVIRTKHGNKILATSLGNFIHPSLSAQANNVALQAKWNYDEKSKRFDLLKVNAVKISCDGGSCLNKGTFKVF